MMLKKIYQIKDYLLYGSGQVVNLVAPLLVAPYMVILAGVDNWGLVGQAIAGFTLLGIFIDFGSQLVGVKELSINKNDTEKIKKQIEEVYTFRIIMFLVLTILVLAVMVFTQTKLTSLYVCGLSMLAASMLNPLWIYQAFEEFKIINRIVIISKLLYVVTVLCFVRNQEHYAYTLLCLGGTNAIVYGYFLLMLFKKYNVLLFRVPVKQLRDNFKKELPFAISNFSIAVYSFGPILIVGNVGGKYLAGLYHLGDMLLKIIRSYLSVFFNVSFPKFCTAYNDNKQKGIHFLKKINKFHLLLVTAVALLGYLMLTVFINNFAIDKELHKGIQFSTGFLGLAVIIALNIPFYQMLVYYNKQKEVSVISTFGAAIMLVSCYCLTDFFGLYGSLLSLYIVEVFITVSIILVYYRYIGRKHLELKGNI